MQTVSSTVSQPSTHPSSDRPASKPTQRELAKRASEIAALLRREGKAGLMSREQLIKHINRLLRSKETPVQYHAPLISQLAELQGWKRANVDDKSQSSIGEVLGAWKREDAGAYAGLMNQHTQADANQQYNVTTSHVRNQQVACAPGGPAVEPAGGEPPISGTPSEALDPLTPATSPEKVAQPVDSTVVNAVKPADTGGDWVE